MSLDNWFWFCMTEAVLSLTPGPAVLLVVSMSLSRGFRAGLAASLGILSINALFFALSATSIGALLLASGELFLVVKWLGAGYLVWLGLKMLFSTFSESSVGDEAPVTMLHSARRSFSLGLLTQGANPKAILFFTAILPQFIEPKGSVGFQLLVLGVSSILIELVILSVYVATCHAARSVARDPRFSTPLRRFGGLLLVIAGARLAMTRRE